MGPSGSGKSNLANALSVDLRRQGDRHFLIDGDNSRLGLNQDLDFKQADRTEKIRRTADVARVLVDAGLIVLVALVASLKEDTQLAQAIVGAGRCRLVQMATPLDVCEARDPKEPHRRARAGKIPGFTGIRSQWEAPRAANLRVEDGFDFHGLCETVGLSCFHI